MTGDNVSARLLELVKVIHMAVNPPTCSFCPTVLANARSKACRKCTPLLSLRTRQNAERIAGKMRKFTAQQWECYRAALGKRTDSESRIEAAALVLMKNHKCDACTPVVDRSSGWDFSARYREPV